MTEWCQCAPHDISVSQLVSHGRTFAPFLKTELAKELGPAKYLYSDLHPQNTERTGHCVEPLRDLGRAEVCNLYAVDQLFDLPCPAYGLRDVQGLLGVELWMVNCGRRAWLLTRTWSASLGL